MEVAELQAALQQMGLACTMDECSALIKRFDAGGDGALQYEDLVGLAGGLGETSAITASERMLRFVAHPETVAEAAARTVGCASRPTRWAGIARRRVRAVGDLHVPRGSMLADIAFGDGSAIGADRLASNRRRGAPPSSVTRRGFHVAPSADLGEPVPQLFPPVGASLSHDVTTEPATLPRGEPSAGKRPHRREVVPTLLRLEQRKDIAMCIPRLEVGTAVRTHADSADHVETWARRRDERVNHLLRTARATVVRREESRMAPRPEDTSMTERRVTSSEETHGVHFADALFDEVDSEARTEGRTVLGFDGTMRTQAIRSSVAPKAHLGRVEDHGTSLAESLRTRTHRITSLLGVPTRSSKGSLAVRREIRTAAMSTEFLIAPPPGLLSSHAPEPLDKRYVTTRALFFDKKDTLPEHKLDRSKLSARVGVVREAREEFERRIEARREHEERFREMDLVRRRREEDMGGIGTQKANDLGSVCRRRRNGRHGRASRSSATASGRRRTTWASQTRFERRRCERGWMDYACLRGGGEEEEGVLHSWRVVGEIVGLFVRL